MMDYERLFVTRNWVGKPVRRNEDTRFVTGEANYVDDLDMDCAHVAILRSILAHARIKKIDTRINFGPQINYTQYASVINSVKSLSKTVTPGVSLWISKQKEKKYDFSINDEIDYNANTTSQNSTRIHYYTNTFSVNGTIYYKKVWSLMSDFQYYWRQKTSQISINLNSNQWGARIQRTFHNNEFTAYISVHDILNDNIGIDRSFYGNTYTQVTNDRLKRYFLIGFEWDFKNKASK